MKKMVVLLVIALQLLISKGFSQVDLKMIVRNPVPSELSVWAEDPTVVQVILTNTTSKELLNCFLTFTITNESGDVIAQTDAKSRFVPKFQISAAPSVTLLSGDRVFNLNAMNYDKRLERLALSTNSIPEGDYEICVSVFDQYGKNITMGEQYCTGFSVLIPEPPVLISPVDDEVVRSSFPSFLWTPVVNYNPARNQIKYKLKICPVFKGQSPRDAIDRNQVLFEKNDLYTTSYQYLPSDMGFDYFNGVTRFVWMVQAFDANNNPASSNQGKSELGTFLTEEEVLQEMEFANVFPVNNDTIPWEMPHLVAALSPCSDDVRSVSFILTVRDENSTHNYTNSRTIDFSSGPKNSQLLTDDEKAGWLIGNLTGDKAFPDWMQELKAGKKYFWSLEATYTNSDGTTFTESSTETPFVIGLKHPTALYPKADTTMRANNAIDLKLTIPRPATLNLLTSGELDLHEFHGYNAYSQAKVNLKFELAKKESFDSLLQTKSLVVPENGQLRTGDNCDALYQTLKTKFDAIADTGTYYWRLKYLDKNDSAYYTTAARKLTIVPDSMYNCFAMEVLQLANDGKWTENKKPRFALTINPEIKKTAITGGRIRVWKKSEPTQSIEAAKLSKAVLDTTFTGNADSLLYAYSADLSGNMRMDINLINGNSKSKTFEGDSAAYYVWNFQLKYNKDSIRVDKKVCGCDSVLSNDGVFQILPSNAKKNNCPGDCYAQMPTNTTPGTQTLAKDSTLKLGKFDMKLITVSGTPSGLSGTGSIKVPYLMTYILVEFNNLQVNSEGQVYSGEAFAKVDDDAPYTKGEGNDFQNKAYNFAADKMKFKRIYEHSSSLGKLVSGFVGSTPVTLPIGYDHDWDGYKFVVGIVGMRFTPTYGELNVATYVELPSLGPDVGLGLGAKNICFHKDGFGGLDKVMLYLAQDLGVDNSESWSFLFKSPTPSDSGTYVLWDCNGMTDLTIAADVAFPRSWATPVGNSDPMAQVKAHFKGRARKYGSSWQWLVGATIDNCELACAPGYKLQFQDVIYDKSDSINPSGIVFPGLYTGKKTTQWQGFYVKRASVTLPEDLKTFANESPTFAINNMLIDEMGFTASVVGNNLIQYPKGNFGGWGASLDSLRFDWVCSSLQSGGLSGRLKMSIADTCLIYRGTFATDTTKKTDQYTRKTKYLFSVTPKDTLKVDMVKADFNLLKTSTIQLYNDSLNKFKACADLSGSITIKGNVGGLSKLDFKGVKFENLKVMNSDPYFDVGNWSLASPEHGMNGFPVSISNIKMVTGERNGGVGAGLQFDLNVGLQEGSNAISGSTKLSIWGKLESGSGPQHFAFDGVDLDSIGVDADLGAVVIRGGLSLYDSDNTFGDGFRGVVTATFVDQATLEATAQFGSVNSYRYWYIDGKMIFTQGIPIVTGLDLYGFGGGAWYHMNRTGEVSLSGENSPANNGTTPGVSNSGYHYVPDRNVDLGLEASVVLGTNPSPDAFNGDIGLRAQFLSNGGIGDISLFGEGYMLCEMSHREKAKVLAETDLNYNFPTKTFHGTFDVDINADPLDGGGQMVMHFDPNLWYVKIGEPSNRIGIDLAGWLSADGYFMMGQDLPAPQLPAEIAELFPDANLYRTSQIGNGDGFAFGVSSGFDTGRQTFLIFYGQVSALVGCDMALLKYPEGTTCEGSSDQIGVNGWYAMGDIYASVAASIGIHVDLWFTSGNFEILGLQVKAALMGAGPNPTWMKGAVAGDYRILGGAVKGHCDFHFSMGHECEIASENPLVKVDLISDIDPASGDLGVDVCTEPQVAMNFELDTPFELNEMPEGSGSSKIRTFRIKLSQLSLKKTGSNDSISGYLNISPDKFSAYYKPHDIMAGNSYYRLSASAYGEELINNNWGLARKKDGSVINQSANVTFKTGPSPDRILPQNVAYCYPVSSHKYFLQNECRSGRIQLISGQPYLFGPRVNYDVQFIARFLPTDINAAAVDVPFTYNSASKAVLFDIPTLLNNQRYYLQIIRKETCNNPQVAQMEQLMQTIQQGGVMSNITLYQKKLYGSGKSTAFVDEKKISGSKVNPGEKLLYVLYFKTSQFNTLQAKLSTFSYKSTTSEFGANHNEVHTATYQGAEYFDKYDFEPVRWSTSGAYNYFGPLVKINGYEKSSAWHNSFANPTVYNQITWMRDRHFWGSTVVEYERYFTDSNRNFVDVGYNSAKASFTEIFGSMMGSGAVSGSGSSSGGTFSSSGISASITSSVFSPSAGSVAGISGLQSVFGQSESPQIMVTYNHGIIVPVDYNRLRDRAGYVRYNFFISKTSSEISRLNAILNSNYTPMTHGSYPMKFWYNYSGCYVVDGNNAPPISKPFVY